MKLTRHLASSLFTEKWAIQGLAMNDLRLQYASAIKAGELLPDEGGDAASENVRTVNGVYILPIFGVLTKHCADPCVVNYDDIRIQIQTALNDPNIESILLWVHSPGGWVLGVETLGNFIAESSQKKPIYTFVDGICCSAAYWLASQTTAIYCTADAVLGSIGVFSEYLNVNKMLTQMGIEPHVFFSHSDKVAGNPDMEWNKDYDAKFQAEILATKQKFADAVKSKRPLIQDAQMTGWDFSGEDSVTFGLADGIINSLEETVMFLSQKNPSGF